MKTRAVRIAACIGLFGCGGEVSEQPDGSTESPVAIVDSPDDLASLPEQVLGDLEVEGAAFGPILSLSNLTRVQGRLDIRNTSGLERIELPVLAEVTGTLLVERNADLRELSMPALVHAGDVVVRDNAALGALTAHVLQSSASLTLSRNPELAEVSLPLLDFLPSEGLPSGFQQGLSVRENLALERLELPALANAASVWISGNTRMTSVRLPILRELLHLYVFQPLLSELSLPSLEALHTSELIHHEIMSASLRELRFPKLRQIDAWMSLSTAGLRVLDMPVLTSIEVFAVGSQSLTHFEAPSLTRAGGSLSFRWERLASLTLPSLAEGCENVTPVPDCAVSAVLPNCPVNEVRTIAGCTCDAGGAFTNVVCPEPEQAH